LSRRETLSFNPDKVVLRSDSSEIGNSIEEVSCTFQFLKLHKADSEEISLEIAFNTKYLLDFLTIHGKLQDKQRMIWKFSSAQGQSEISFEGEERMFSYILVPLKG
jgi:DNA polymerase III sliding clamp (beta) subunit (PCNA family)